MPRCYFTCGETAPRLQTAQEILHREAQDVIHPQAIPPAIEK